MTVLARPTRHRPAFASQVVQGIIPAIDDALAALSKAGGELTAANNELLKLEGRQSRSVAEAADAAAFAEARRKGKPDPGAVNADEHSRQLADGQRRQAGLRAVIAGLQRDLDRAIEVHGHTLAAALIAARKGHLAEQREHEVAVTAAAEAAGRVGRVLEWLQSGSGAYDEDD